MKSAFALVVAVLVGIVTAAPAEAHTSLVSAVPATNSTVSSPGQIKLTFADPVRFTGVVVLDAAGHHHESGRSQAVDNTVTEQITGRLTAGVYTVGWRVVSPDGHPVTGEYRFTVAGGAAPGSAGSPSPAGSPAGTPASRQATTPAAQPDNHTSSAGWWWIALASVVLGAAAATVALIRHRS